jgi:hypothetical protein
MERHDCLQKLIKTITTSSLSTEYVQSTEGHQHMGDVQERIGTVRALWQMFDSGLPVALHDPLHSTLHVGISLLRLMQPIPLEERNRHNVPAHCRQQPITQAGVAERLQCIPGEVQWLLSTHST